MSSGSMTTIWPYPATLGFLIILGLYSWRRGNVPGARHFAVACLFSALWLCGAFAEMLAVGVPAKILWHEFQVVCQLPTVTATFCFGLEYVFPHRRLTRRRMILLSVAPLLLLLLVITNDLHHLFWRGFIFDGSLHPLRGVANWVLMGYGMVLSLVLLAAFVWLFIRSPLHRWPVGLMVITQIIARVLYTLSLVPEQTVLGWDPLILGFLITYGVYSFAFFGFRILDPLPAARRLAIDQMQDGMVVFDNRWQVLSLNPTAERIFDVPATRMRGKPWSDLLPSYPDADQYVDSMVTPPELYLPEGLTDIAGTTNEARRYVLALSRLQGRRGLTTGYLLLLRDVTDQHRAQAQLLEQQWAQATLQERELLAHELHDGLAQNLGFLNLQVQATRLFLQSGQEEAALGCLDRLADVTSAMQGDTRELIGDLLTISLPSDGLCSVMRRAVTHFEEQTRLLVDLELADDLYAICDLEALPPAAGVQLLRILQESLANVRKHAGSPDRISVQLKTDGGQLKMKIVDNGLGFDLIQTGVHGKHFGLQVMSRRAERIGGTLTVYSAPDQGTRVEVCVPLNGNAGRVQ